MAHEQLRRIADEVAAETEDTRMVTELKWYKVAVPHATGEGANDQQPATLVEDADDLVRESLDSVEA
jgi:hypothetical protein